MALATQNPLDELTVGQNKRASSNNFWYCNLDFDFDTNSEWRKQNSKIKKFERCCQKETNSDAILTALQWRQQTVIKANANDFGKANYQTDAKQD